MQSIPSDNKHQLPQLLLVEKHDDFEKMMNRIPLKNKK